VFVVGVTSTVPDIWKMGVRSGSFIPKGDASRGAPITVLGAKLKTELFGNENPLGKYVHISGRRFQVIGVMAEKGEIIGLDTDDRAYIPVALAMKLFNREELQEIDVVFSTAKMSESVADAVRQALKSRHEGRQDFSIITETEMVTSLNKILGIITMGIGAIAAISLLVGTI